MPARPGKVWSGMPQVTNLPCTCSPCARSSAAVDGRARCGRRLEDKNGEERERRRDTHFMYASSGDSFVTSAVEMMRSNSSEYGSAKLSPTAYTASAAPSFFASASLCSWREKAVTFLGAERVAEDDSVVAQRSAVSTCGAVWGRGRTSPPKLMTATFLPEPTPAPSRTRGE
jgi:hypothetical protein